MNIKQSSIPAYYADPHSQRVNRTQSARYSSRSSSSITVKTPRDALIGFPSFIPICNISFKPFGDCYCYLDH
jgi:hypothetical protein